MLKFFSMALVASMMFFSSAVASESTKTSLNKARRVRYMKLNINSDRMVLLKGPIRYQLVQNVIDKIRSLDEDTNKNIFMIINSPGGSIADGLELITAMQSTKSKIYCAIETEAFSMAAVIALFCHKTFIHKYAAMMFHESSIRAEGQASQMFSQMEFLKNYLHMFDKTISDQMGITLKKYHHMNDSVWWLTAKQAAKYGVVDGILNRLNYYVGPEYQGGGLFTLGFDKHGGVIKNPLRTLDRW